MRKIFLFIFFYGALIIGKAQNKSAYTEKLDSVITYSFTGQNWESSWFYKYNIDTNGVFHNYKEFIWLRPENRLQQVNYDYQYDPKGNLSVESLSAFVNNKWEVFNKTDYFYRQDTNLLIAKNEYEKDDNIENWLVKRKMIYHYDSNSVLIKTTDSFLNYLDVFLKYSEVNYTYNSLGKVIQENELRWDEDLKEYRKHLKYDYTYLNDLYLVEKVRSVWDYDTKSWIAIDKQEYHLDANLNTIKVVDYNIDIDSTMILYFKTEFQFDLNVELTEVAFPFFVPYFYYGIYNKPISYKNYRYNRHSKDWTISDSAILIYTDINTTSGLLKSQKELTKAYPNPASEFVNFDLSKMPTAKEVLIFDVKGKQVLSHSFTNGDQMDISELSKGFYMYKIISDDNTSSGKLILE